MMPAPSTPNSHGSLWMFHASTVGTSAVPVGALVDLDVHEVDAVGVGLDHVEQLVEHRPAVLRLAAGRRREHHGDRLARADDVGERHRVQRARRLAGADRIDAERVSVVVGDAARGAGMPGHDRHRGVVHLQRERAPSAPGPASTLQTPGSSNVGLVT